MNRDYKKKENKDRLLWRLTVATGETCWRNLSRPSLPHQRRPHQTREDLQWVPGRWFSEISSARWITWGWRLCWPEMETRLECICCRWPQSRRRSCASSSPWLLPRTARSRHIMWKKRMRESPSDDWAIPEWYGDRSVRAKKAPRLYFQF